MPRPTRVPDDIDLPGWVSEARASLTDRDASPVVHRSDRQRARARRGRERTAPVVPLAVIEDSPWLTRAERRRRLSGDGRHHQTSRHTSAVQVEMVPPSQPGEDATRTRRREATGHPGSTSALTFARRRAAAALVLTTMLALLLWSFWPSQDSSSPKRDTADLTSAALRQKSDPTAAAEELASTPTTTPLAGAVPVSHSGTGKTTPVALPAIAAPTLNPGRTVRVGLEVEDGTGIDVEEAATIISATLGDEHGWQTRDKVRFRAVSTADLEAGAVDLTIVLASPELTDKLCAPLKTRGEVSCFNLRKVVLNVRRWTQGVSGYAGNLPAYRQYMVNHEVGHGLYHGHVECPGKGKIAPVMLQQSKGLDGCAQNPWPTVG